MGMYRNTSVCSIYGLRKKDPGSSYYAAVMLKVLRGACSYRPRNNLLKFSILLDRNIDTTGETVRCSYNLYQCYR